MYTNTLENELPKIAMEEVVLKAYEEMEEKVSKSISENNKSKEFLSNILDTNPDLVFTKDSQGRFTHVNKAVRDFYGVTDKELIGKPAFDFNRSKDEIAKIQNSDLQALKEWLGSYVFEKTLKDSQGNLRHFQIIKRLLLNGDIIEGVVVVATDLTERKKLEEDLRKAQKLETIGQLATGIAHEINTPTQYVGDNTRFVEEAFEEIKAVLNKYNKLLEQARIDGYSPELLKEVEDEIENADMEFLSEEIPVAVKQSLEGVKRIAKIVQSMKNFAHPGSEDKKSVDLNKAIESTITVARNEWKYVAELKTDFDESLPKIPCILGELNQVILNIIVNAAHAIADVTDEGNQGKGEITISTSKVSDEWAKIQITDTGGGIPKAIQKRIFDPFFTTKDFEKGTGQGLAISQTFIVDNHQGKLDFETEEGKGTTFIIQLPINPKFTNRTNRSISR